ncbi:MAG TPA: sugar ABC transporter ATP-binding protein [Solirubrobacteraceae bacterium]|nr:sugar ABC transporter ATP-binding protein [Solirubrobacteraceae bacterium]
MAGSGDLAHVELRGITKRFAGTTALDDVTVAIRAGSVHALVGENGAGKSTLGKILAGVHSPDEGQLLIRGEPVSLHSPREALDHGIATIGQEPSVVPYLTVAENVFLGAEPRRLGTVRRRALHRRYDALLGSSGFTLRGDRLAGSLRISEQQEVEILRALSRSAEVVIMDEPTAALSGPDTARLHEIVRSLAAQGKTVLLISHFLREVLDLADTVTILRDGRFVRTASTDSETEDSLIEGMLGRPLASTFPPKRPPAADAPVVLRASGVRAPGVAGVDLVVRAGEIVGLAGLVGAGRSELGLALFGANPVHDGEITLNDAPLRGGPRRRLQAGLALIPESRKDQGLVLDRPVFENASLPRLRSLSRAGVVTRRHEQSETHAVLERCDVRARSFRAPVRALSGGNQQKVLFARVFLCQPSLVIADEPTRGVDVGAKRAIYDFLAELAEQGLGVLLISSELEELIGLAHRVVVMRAGQVAAELDGDAIDESAILAAAFGNRPREAA